MAERRCLAVDVGGSSIKMLTAHYTAGRIEIDDQRSVSVAPVVENGHVYIDVAGIVAAIKSYAGDLLPLGIAPQTIGIDTFGNGYGLLDERRVLLGRPYFYKDGRTKGILPRVADIVPLYDLYCATGVYPTEIRVLMQLFYDAQDPHHEIHRCWRMLLLPDLLNFYLTGQVRGEESIASVANLLCCSGDAWATEVIKKLKIPLGIFPELVKGGTLVSGLDRSVAREIGYGPRVVTVTSHDTESALLAAPQLDENCVFASIGTSIIFGARTRAPVISRQGFDGAFKTVKGPFYYSLCRDFNAMWLFEKCMQAWRADQPALSYEDVMDACTAAGENATYCNVCDPALRVEQGDMLRIITEYCRGTGQSVPSGVGEVANVVIDSMVLQALWSYRQIQQITGRETYRQVAAVGGGIRNGLLMQRLADALGIPVVTGSTVSSALGNVLMQLYATGEIKTDSERQQVLKNTVSSNTFYPHPACREKWEKALLILKKIDDMRKKWR